MNPDRNRLYERINVRAQQMFDSGLLEETRALLAQYGATAPVLSSLGYKQAAQMLSGGLTKLQAVQAAQQAHRNYAKRQMTWFRREPDVHWLNGFGDEERIQQDGINLVRAALFQS